MRTFLFLVAACALIVVAVYALSGCALSIETGCSVTRTTEIVRTNGQPETTVMKSARTCGDHPPSIPAARGGGQRLNWKTSPSIGSGKT